MESLMFVKENIAEIKQKMAIACQKSGRNENEVVLMAVSKTQPIEKLQAAHQAGLCLFGENKVQEMQSKAEFFAQKGIDCHLIGTLQTNKAKYLPGLTSFVHSVDSVKLAIELNKQYQKHGKTVDILLQINIANEATKSGIKKEDTLEIAKQISQFENIKLRGLMCIPPQAFGEKARCNFGAMRKLFESVQNNLDCNNEINVLSMGMSDDYEIAIEEGSTLVRVGSALFGQRNYNK